MARRADYADSDIIAAGDRLIAAKKEVSGWALREELGGGKPSRLKAIWEAHVAAGPGATPPRDQPAVTLPPRIAEAAAELRGQVGSRLDELVLDTYRVVDGLLQGRYQQEMEQLRAKRLAYEEDGARAEQAVEAAEGEADRLSGLLAEEATKAADALKHVAVLETRLTAVEDQARRVGEEASKRIAGFEGRVATLGAALDDARRGEAAAQALAQARGDDAERLRAEGQKAAAEGKAALDKVNAELAAATRRAEAAEHDRDAAARAAATAAERDAAARQDLNRRLAQAEQGLETARKEATEAKQAAARAEGDRAATERGMAALTAAMDKPRPPGQDTPASGGRGKDGGRGRGT